MYSTNAQMFINKKHDIDIKNKYYKYNYKLYI